jgi:hypothetical protein
MDLISDLYRIPEVDESLEGRIPMRYCIPDIGEHRDGKNEHPTNTEEYLSLV